MPYYHEAFFLGKSSAFLVLVQLHVIVLVHMFHYLFFSTPCLTLMPCQNEILQNQNQQHCHGCHDNHGYHVSKTIMSLVTGEEQPILSGGNTSSSGPPWRMGLSA